MKYEFMKQNENEFSIERMSKMFNVSRSGYYHFVHAKPSNRVKENERLFVKIKTIHDASRHTYGSPRIHAELKSQGETCSRKRVAKLMQQKKLQAKMKKRFKRTTRQIFPDNTMAVAAIDRLIHHATIINIQEQSYRKVIANKINQ
jgi:putative transposase